jgi:hypothetical protein
VEVTHWGGIEPALPNSCRWAGFDPLAFSASMAKLQVMNFGLPLASLESAASAWKAHEFYASAIVLGIDIGIEGLGLYLRRGPLEVAAASVVLELPDAKALEARRQKRAWRHCRKNRRTRLARLRSLFEGHGLPWVEEEKLARVDPFELRFRALNTHVASPEALSICIRHCVTHRGYDYDILGSDQDEGAYPWGDGTSGSTAMVWLRTSFLTDELATWLRDDMTDELTWAKNPEKSREDYLALVAARLAESKSKDIRAVLDEHRKSDKHVNLRTRARGYNFPRSEVAAHLRQIITHPEHAAMIRDVDAFLSALFLKPKTPGDRERAVFYYHRKTPEEMRAIWERKRSRCRYAIPLGLAGEGNAPPTGKNGEWHIRRWNILEFAATRRVEIELAAPKLPKGTPKSEGKVPKRVSKDRFRHRLSGGAIEALLDLVKADADAVKADRKDQRASLEDARKIIETDLADAYPDVNGKSRAKTASSSRDHDFNKSFFTQLKDLIAPSKGNLNQTASLSVGAAEKLFAIAIDAAPEHERWYGESIVERLKTLGYYDWKRRPNFDYGYYPQVEKLLGPVRSVGKVVVDEKTMRRRTCGGLLSRWFAQYADVLGGALNPDYCVIEVASQAPRSKTKRAEILKEMNENRQRREEAWQVAGLEDTGVTSRRRRIALYAQQRGRCPFSGDELPDPLSPELELEHLFPESRGGLSIDDNLVLTFRKTNADKGQRTPKEFAEEVRLESFAAMLPRIQEMKWGDRKRAIFAWGTDPDAGSFPDFGNTTRIGQLARQLKAAVQQWMGLLDHPNESTRRIGTPSGWLTAQARKSWLEKEGYLKARSNHSHHLLDAAVLAHIPPGSGQNSVACGGIFYPVWEEPLIAGSERTTRRPVTRALPGLSPAKFIAHWMPPNLEYEKCPVLKLSSRSKYRSIGDATFWRQVKANEPTVAQRVPLTPKSAGDAEKLMAILNGMTPADPIKAAWWKKNLPSASQIDDWLDRATAATKGKEDAEAALLAPPLRLMDGTPVRNIWKFDTKGSLTGLGWSGVPNETGSFAALRLIDGKFVRLELWLGWNEKKKRWEYQKRLVPEKAALRHAQRLGLVWSRDRRVKAPVWMQEKPDVPETHVSFRELICPALYRRSIKVGAIARGDVFKLGLSREGDIVSESPHWSTEFIVSAIKENTQIEFKSLLFKDPSGTPLDYATKNWLKQAPSSAEVLAAIIGLPKLPAELASARTLNPPPSQDDPSLDTHGGGVGAVGGKRAADFRLE